MRKLEDTRNIAEGSVIRVYKKGFGYATVTAIAAHDMFIALQCDSDLMLSIAVGDIMECYLWVEDVASYEFNCEIIGTIPDDPRIIFCRNTSEIVKNKERKCLGAKTALTIKYFVFNPGETRRGLHSEPVVFHDGILVWIEDREAVIKTDIPIADNMFIMGHVQIDGMDTEIVGRVSALNAEKNIYNILYTGELNEDRNRILEYIFKTYRE